MLAARMTLPHFLVSSEMSFAKSPGEPASTTAPKLASRASNLESAMLAPTSRLNRSMISADVFFGAHAVPCAYLETGKVSARTGTSASAFDRVAVVTAKARSLPALIFCKKARAHGRPDATLDHRP
jgi:hypothetical protein